MSHAVSELSFVLLLKREAGPDQQCYRTRVDARNFMFLGFSPIRLMA